MSSFVVVQFEPTENDRGGISIIKETWLTPLKREAFWPPHKDQDKFKNCLLSGEKIDEDSWSLFPVSRIFYTTGKLIFYDFKCPINDAC